MYLPLQINFRFLLLYFYISEKSFLNLQKSLQAENSHLNAEDPY
jgi:hypothetical protein